MAISTFELSNPYTPPQEEDESGRILKTVACEAAEIKERLLRISTESYDERLQRAINHYANIFDFATSPTARIGSLQWYSARHHIWQGYRELESCRAESNDQISREAIIETEERAYELMKQF